MQFNHDQNHFRLSFSVLSLVTRMKLFNHHLVASALILSNRIYFSILFRLFVCSLLIFCLFCWHIERCCVFPIVCTLRCNEIRMQLCISIWFAHFRVSFSHFSFFLLSSHHTRSHMHIIHYTINFSFGFDSFPHTTAHTHTQCTLSDVVQLTQSV